MLNIHCTNKTILNGINKAHDRKHILIKSLVFYKEYVSEGKKNYLFQYHICSINSDQKTVVIHFDESTLRIVPRFSPIIPRLT